LAVGVDQARDALFGAVRALSPNEFEELVRLLPAHWNRALNLEGIDTGQPGFGVLLKARWQNFPRKLRRGFARELGAAAQRLAGGPTPPPRVAALAAIYRGPGGAAAHAVEADPGALAQRLNDTAEAAREALQAATDALADGRACPDTTPQAVNAYNETFAAARTLLSERGVQRVPDRRDALTEQLEQLARGGDRTLLRGALAALSAVETDLDLVRDARRAANYLLDKDLGEWSEEDERLARALAAVVDLRRLAAAGADPGDLLAVSRRAQPLLPPDLHGLVVLAASGGFTLPEPSAVDPADDGGSAVA
jgi:hypothetical protein